MASFLDDNAIETTPLNRARLQSENFVPTSTRVRFQSIKNEIETSAEAASIIAAAETGNSIWIQGNDFMSNKNLRQNVGLSSSRPTIEQVGLFYRSFPRQFVDSQAQYIQENQLEHFPIFQLQEVKQVATFRSHDLSSRAEEIGSDCHDPQLSSSENYEDTLKGIDNGKDRQKIVYQTASFGSAQRQVSAQSLIENDINIEDNGKITEYLNQMLNSSQLQNQVEKAAVRSITRIVNKPLDYEEEVQRVMVPKPENLSGKAFGLSWREISKMKNKQKSKSNEKLNLNKQQKIFERLELFYQNLKPKNMKANQANNDQLRLTNNQSISEQRTTEIKQDKSQKSSNIIFQTIERSRTYSEDDRFERKHSNTNIIKKELLSKEQNVLDGLLSVEELICEANPNSNEYIDELRDCIIVSEGILKTRKQELIITKCFAKALQIKAQIEIKDLQKQYQILSRDINKIQMKIKITSKQNNIAAKQEEGKFRETILLLTDMRMRVSQKLFFEYVGRARVIPRIKAVLNLAKFETIRNRILTRLSLASFTHNLRVRKLKKKFMQLTQQGLNYKILAAVFVILKSKYQKHIIYKQASKAIRMRRKNNFLRCIFQGFKNECDQIKRKKRRIQLAALIHCSHLITRGFLILKAFAIRKREGNKLQTMKARNIASQLIDEFQQIGKEIKQVKNEIVQNMKQTNREFQKINRMDQQHLNIHSINNQKFCPSQKNSDVLSSSISQYFLDGTYDSLMYERNFICEEEILLSAKNIKSLKNDLLLINLDKQGIKEHLSFDFNQQIDCSSGNNLVNVANNELLIKKVLLSLRLTSNKVNNRKRENKLGLFDLKKFSQLNFSQNGSKQIDVKFQQQNILKLIIQTEEKERIMSVYYLWRNAFLQKRLDFLIREKYLADTSRSLFNIWKQFSQFTKENIQQINQNAALRKKQNILTYWNKQFHIREQKKIKTIEKFQKFIIFKRFKQNKIYQQKANLVSHFFQANTAKKTFIGWKKLADMNEQARCIYKFLRCKRIFRIWKQQMKRKLFLKEFWKKILYSPNELLFQRHKTQENLIKAMLMAWRDIVLENGHSKRQRIQQLYAQKHYQSRLKTRIFFDFISKIKQNKSLQIIFKNNSAVIRCVSRSLFTSWKSALADCKLIMSEYVKRKEAKKVVNVFNILKSNLEKKRKCQSLLLKKFYFSWKNQAFRNQIQIPSQKRSKRLEMLVISSLMLNQLKSMKQKAKLEVSTQFFLRLIKNSLGRYLRGWKQQIQKRVEQQSLEKKLTKYAQKQLKRRVFQSLKLVKILGKLKNVLFAKANQFKELKQKQKYSIDRLLSSDQNGKKDLQFILNFIHRWRKITQQKITEQIIQERYTKYQNRQKLQSLFQRWRIIQKKLQKENQLIEVPFCQLECNLIKVFSNKQINKNIVANAQNKLGQDKQQSDGCNIQILDNQIDNKQIQLNRQYSPIKSSLSRSPSPPKIDQTMKSRQILNESSGRKHKSVRFERISSNTSLCQEQRQVDDLYNQNEAFYQKLIKNKISHSN